MKLYQNSLFYKKRSPNKIQEGHHFNSDNEDEMKAMSNINF